MMERMTIVFCGLVWSALGQPAPAQSTTGPGASVLYADKFNELTILGFCGANPDGAYNIWAVTPDPAEPSVAKEGAARLHTVSDGTVSVLKFYPDGSDTALVVRGEGDGLVVFDDGALHYAGPVGDTDKTIEIHLRC